MLKEILQKNGMPELHCDEAVERSKEPLFFLAEDFVRKYYRIACLPEEHLDYTVSTARRFDESADLRALCMYLYICFCEDPEMHPLSSPEFIDPLGYDCGILYLLILVSLIPKMEERAVREKFPMKYAWDAASRTGTLPVYYAQKYSGHFGIRLRSMLFMKNFVYKNVFRIGRFDFSLEKGWNLPHIYENSNGIKYLFCPEGWKLDPDGDRLSDNTEIPGMIEAHFSEDGTTVKGLLIDPVEGLAEKKETALPCKDLHKIAGPGDWSLRYHIPAGGGMKKELCQRSFQEAWDFFAHQYPDTPAHIIFTTSWINNPEWTRYMPHSNMAEMIRSSAIFPSIGSKNAGFYFVFGHDDPDYASYPRTNSLERAVLDCMRDHGKIRTAGNLIYADVWKYGKFNQTVQK